MASWKDNIHFILVEPKEPGNIGASARAIKNMGFNNLHLVNPQLLGVHTGKQSFPLCDPQMLPRHQVGMDIFDRERIRGFLEDSEARWLAAGAIDVLKRAGISKTLREAISDKALVVGTTTRTGKRRGVILPVEEGVKRIKEVASGNRVAILFGREDKGLLNEEVRACGFLMTIKTSKIAPSLNLSQAVLLVAYELSRTDEDDKIELPSLRLVSYEDIDILLKRIEEALLKLGYIPRGDRDLQRKIMQNMSFLLKRSGLTDWELNMLHGICTRIIEGYRNSV